MVPLGLILLFAAFDSSSAFGRDVLPRSVASNRPGIACKGFFVRDASNGRVLRHRLPGDTRLPDASRLRHLRDSTGLDLIPNRIGILHEDGSSEPIFPEQWSLANTGQAFDGATGLVGADIGALSAWAQTSGDSSVVVAFLDGGIDIRHPEFQGKLAYNVVEKAGSAGVDDDGNGYVDDTLGWDFVRDDGVARDLGGHGTATASLVAGAWDDNGIAGLAPGVRVLPIRVADGGSRVELVDLVEGVDYAVARKAKVVNLSLGGLESPEAIDSAIARAVRSGAVVVVSAGNEGLNLDTDKRYPAALRMKGLLVVGASSMVDERSYYSNHSTNLVDLSAPGDALLAGSIPAGQEIWSEDFESGISGWTTGGTSSVSWGIETIAGSARLSDGPGKTYASSGTAWIRSPKLNPDARSALVLGMSLRGRVSAGDVVRIESAPDTTFATGVDTILEYGGFYQSDAVSMSADVGQDGRPFYLRFSLTSSRPGSTLDSGVQFDSLVLVAHDVAQPPAGTYARVWGTSFSAPLTSGAVALLASLHPDAKPESLVAAILDGAKPVASLASASITGARLWIPGAFQQFQVSTRAVSAVRAGGAVRVAAGLRVLEQGAWSLEWRDVRGAVLGRASGVGPGLVPLPASGSAFWTLRASGRNLSGMALAP